MCALLRRGWWYKIAVHWSHGTVWPWPQRRTFTSSPVIPLSLRSLSSLGFFNHNIQSSRTSAGWRKSLGGSTIYFYDHVSLDLSVNWNNHVFMVNYGEHGYGSWLVRITSDVSGSIPVRDTQKKKLSRWFYMGPWGQWVFFTFIYLVWVWKCKCNVSL